MNARKIAVRLGLLLLIPSLSQAAELKFNRYFSDHMVLQRDKPLVIAGSCDAGADVRVTFAEQAGTAKASPEGEWRVTIDPLQAVSKGRTLTVSASGKRVSLKDVVVGDVIFCARQSAVDVSLGTTEAGKSAAKKHDRSSLLRTISIKTVPSLTPLTDLTEGATSGWTTVNPQSALTMTGSAYYLGRDLVKESGVPVGIVDVKLGYLFPVSWLSREELDQTEKYYGNTGMKGMLQRFDKIAQDVADGTPLHSKEPVTPETLTSYATLPAAGFNAVLNPLRGLALKAAVVQLGNDYPYTVYSDVHNSDAPFDTKELNRAYRQSYDIRKRGWLTESTTLPRIPREWRSVLGDTALPFALVAPPSSDLTTLAMHHREMRELQRLVAEDNDRVDVILPGMDNIPFSAQPQDEALLAHRALNWVRAEAYGKDIPAVGPLFDRMETHFNEVDIYFKAGTAKGLRATGAALERFEAAGVEGDYTPAKASIVGERIHVVSDTVSRITRVRYNWNTRPDQALVNDAGLPAMPFRTERAAYGWLPRNTDSDLPEEYFTPANQWKKNDITLINGRSKTIGYSNFSGWIGPIGINTGPFGPNMAVRGVKAGSPAEGKIFAGDIIYSVNDIMLGDKAWEVMASAITLSETREGNGKMVLGLRRGARNLNVEIVLEVMGSYSPTAPYDCPKTEKIIANLESWLVSKGAGAGFLNTDALFMLATGSPELQGYVRRIVYGIMAQRDPNAAIDPTKWKSWYNSAEALLLGEYYLYSGDRNVLPYLKYACDRHAAGQLPDGGYRQSYPGSATYGKIPNAGLPGVIGMNLARRAGAGIDMAGYRSVVDYYTHNMAETAAVWYGGSGREKPPVFTPEAIEQGRLNTHNGGVSAAGILMRLEGNQPAADLCTFISTYSFHNTYGGHGGSFWNNFWTPLGARSYSREGFRHFMKKHRWYRELNRMFDGSLIQHTNGKAGAGCGIALVAPRNRIQIVGAAPSPFEVDAPAYLKPAVAAYWKRDYAGCVRLAQALLAGGAVSKAERPTVEYLERQAREIQLSIESDLRRMKTLAAEGNPGEARTFLAGLKGILPEDDQRLADLEAVIAAAKQLPAGAVQASTTTALAEKPRDWVRLVSERPGGLGNPPAVMSTHETPSVWKIKILESIEQAPDAWSSSSFDDKEWKTTSLPVSWRMYHTALLRTTFELEDVAQFDGLRFFAWVFRQQNIQIYLNGNLIGKVNELEGKTQNIQNEFKASALSHLRKGENTLAISTRHNWRWGMIQPTVYNDGFDFNLDASIASE